MNLVEVFFGFHSGPGILPILRGEHRLRTICGHVEAWGYTADGTWVFFDPQGGGTKLHVTHHHDEVIERIARRYEVCSLVVKIRPGGHEILIPWHPLMNCAAQCAHLIGLRAYSPWSLRRMLLANGAEVTHDPQGRSRGEEGARAGASHCPSGADLQL